MRRVLIVLAVVIVVTGVFVGGVVYGHYDSGSGRSGVGIDTVGSESQLDSALRHICDQGREYARITIDNGGILPGDVETHTYQC
jgi:hypothetical protein